ncbi:MAG: glycosyltransferase family 39 protein [Myxococcales bacterium]|nr:hypothetical protein [Myxococcales bacterium]
MASRPAPIDVITRPIWFAPFLLACATALSYFYADRTMPVPDEGALLVAAGKILHGGVFYRDIDAYAFPGVSYLLAGFMSIFGEHLSVARGVAGAIYCVTLLGVYASAVTLMNPRRAALCGLSLLSLKFFAFPIYTMFFYADASVAAAILALALFLRHRFDGGTSARLFGVGVLAGLSIATKQSTGILVAFVFALVLVFPAFAHGPRRRDGRLLEVAGYGAGLFLVIAGMSIYFASHGVFNDMIRGGLLRPFTGYLPTSGVSFAPPISWWNFGALKSQALVYYPQAYLELALNATRPGDGARLFYLQFGEVIVRVLYSVIPILFLACAGLWIRAWRRNPVGNIDAGKSDAEISGPDEESAFSRARFFSTAGITLAIVVSAFPRADFIHIITTYPAVALIGFALCRPSMLGRSGTGGDAPTSTIQTRRLHIEAALVILLLASTSFFAIRYDATLSHRLSIERAEVWVRPRDAWLAPMVRYVQDKIPKGESFFVYGHEAHWYYLTDRYTERTFSQLYPGMTGDEDGAQLAKMIRETRPRVIAQGVLRWPGTPSLPRYTGKLRRTLKELYELDPDAIKDPPIPRIMSLWRLREG